MNNEYHANKILHLHIPKTAGTALRQYFSDQIGDGRVSPALSGIRLEEALERWSHVIAVSGHFSMYQGDRLPADYLCLTVLRDPFDRFLSEYYFLKNNNSARPLEVRLRQHDLENYISNLSSDPDSYLPTQIEMLYPLGAAYDSKVSTDEKLAAAKRAVDMLDLVGIQDELEDFECMIAARMGWRPRTLSKVNVTARRVKVSELGEATNRQLHRLLESEIDLYRYARDRFRQDRRRYIVTAPDPSDEQVRNHARVSDPEAPKNFGDRRCEITSVSAGGDISGPGLVMSGERNTIHIDFVVHEEVPGINIGIGFRNESGSLMYGTSSQLHRRLYKLPTGRYSAQIAYYNRLGIGRYYIDANLLRTASHHDDCYHWMERAAYFDVHEASLPIFEGRVLLDSEFSVHTDNGLPIEPLSLDPAEDQVRTFDGIQHPLLEFASRIEVVAKIEALAHSIEALVPVHVCNLGSETWEAMGRSQVTLSYRWYNEKREIVVADGLRTYLPTNMAPGDFAIVPLLIRTPDQTGPHHIVISLVQETVAWFVDRNSESACELSVRILQN